MSIFDFRFSISDLGKCRLRRKGCHPHGLRGKAALPPNRQSEAGNRKSRASALLLVLWAVAVVSMAVLGLAGVVRSNQNESTALQHAFLARQVARSALALASHPRMPDNDPLLSGSGELGGRYAVDIQGEGGRLDINRVLEENRTGILMRLFADWGLDPDDVSQVVESLRVWTDGSRPMDSRERAFYEERGTGFPPHRPFVTVEEMAGVRGMEKVGRHQPAWRDYFTVWTGEALDLNHAPADLIAAVLGDRRVQIETLIQEREALRSMDLSGGNAGRWNDIGVPMGILGIEAESEEAAFFTLNVPIRRIEVTARVGTRQCHLVAVVGGSRLPPGLLHQYER